MSIEIFVHVQNVYVLSVSVIGLSKHGFDKIFLQLFLQLRPLKTVFCFMIRSFMHMFSYANLSQFVLLFTIHFMVKSHFPRTCEQIIYKKPNETMRGKR